MTEFHDQPQGLSIITIWLNKISSKKVGIMFVILRNLSLVNPRMVPKGLNSLVAHFLICRNFVDFMKIIYASFYESMRVHHKLCLWGIIHNLHKSIPFSLIYFIPFIYLFIRGHSWRTQLYYAQVTHYVCWSFAKIKCLNLGHLQRMFTRTQTIWFKPIQSNYKKPQIDSV